MVLIIGWAIERSTMITSVDMKMAIKQPWKNCQKYIIEEEDMRLDVRDKMPSGMDDYLSYNG